MENKGFEAKIILDSINPDSSRVTTFLLTYPRWILAEYNTHRMLSRNSASSRAIPIDKIIEQVRTNPAMPVKWGRNNKGMQSLTAVAEEGIQFCEAEWRMAANRAVESALALQEQGLHKQIVNRVLEPFMWMTTMVTATDWENFYSLRLHRDAQPEFQHLAHLMLKTYLASQPTPKEWNEWHIPFGDKIENVDIVTRLKVATARAARTSYLNVEKESLIEKDIETHDKLAAAGHWSPFEHACQADPKGSGNFRGWKQYRSFFEERENRRCDLQALLASYEEEINAST